MPQTVAVELPLLVSLSVMGVERYAPIGSDPRPPREIGQSGSAAPHGSRNHGKQRSRLAQDSSAFQMAPTCIGVHARAFCGLKQSRSHPASPDFVPLRCYLVMGIEATEWAGRRTGARVQWLGLPSDHMFEAGFATEVSLATVDLP